MLCPNCNSNLMDGTKKCPFCGTEFNNDQNAQPQQNSFNNNNYNNNNYNNNNYNNNSYNSYNNNGSYNSFGSNNYYAPSNQPMVRTKSSPNSLGIIASAAIFIAMFLPFFSVTFIIKVSASLSDSKDWILFTVVAVLGAIFSVKKINMGVLITGIVSIVLTIGEAVLSSEHRLKSKLGEYSDELADYVKIGYDYGFYVMLAASVLLLVAGIKGLSDDRKLKGF